MSSKKIEAIISLSDATAVGEKLFNPTLIAKNADPQIADNIIKRKKLLTGFFVDKN